MCHVPPHLDSSDPIFLFEPDGGNAQLAELDISEGLLEVQDLRKPYGTIPVGNHTKHPIILPRKSALATIQSDDKMISPDQADMSKPKRSVSAILAPASSNPIIWKPNVNLSHLNEEQRAVVKKCFMRKQQHLPMMNMILVVFQTCKCQ